MSPVHDQSYRRYAGTRLPRGRAWAVILRLGIRTLLGRRTFIGLLLLAWLPFLVRSVQIYLVVTYPPAAGLLPINAGLFQTFIEFQGLFAFFVTIYAGAGLIASDRRANALQLYLAKPISRLEYIAGKMGVLLVFLTFVTLVPTILLLVMQIVLSGGVQLVTETPALVPAILIASTIRIVIPALTMLALSSLSNSTRYVSLMYTGVIFFSEALSGVLTFVTGSSHVVWVSVARNFDVVTDAIFGRAPRYDTPVLVSLLVLLALATLSISVLERRVRGVEVVA
jgi:ABC-2 type transport system permease protein